MNACMMMTNLKNLSDKQLSEKLNTLVREERRITTEILWHLKEVDARKLYAALGFGSLFDYCVRALRYSEPAAFRRIEAMRVLRELPEIAKAIEDGSLSVTAVCMAQRVVKSQLAELKSQKVFQSQSAEIESKANNADPVLLAGSGQATTKLFGIDEKRQLISSLVGKSKRECEKLLVAISPQAIPKESFRVLTEQFTEIKFVADEGLVKKLEKIRNLFAHKNSNPSTAALIEMMADLVLKKADPSVQKGRPLKSTTPAEVNAASKAQGQVRVGADTNTATGTGSVNRQPGRPAERSEGLRSEPLPDLDLNLRLRPASRYIPQHLKRAIWQRDKARCTYKTQGTLCGSTHALQIDHIEPFALEGKTTQENLRLLCRTHNQYRARETFT